MMWLTSTNIRDTSQQKMGGTENVILLFPQYTNIQVEKWLNNKDEDMEKWHEQNHSYSNPYWDTAETIQVGLLVIDLAHNQK